MSTQALFIQGAGEGAHATDKKLVASLRQLLGPAYDIHYPVMPHEDDADYETWKVQIASELAPMHDPVLLLGHSVGASMLLKFLSEIAVERTIAGIFLIATPFWGGAGWRYDGFTRLALPEGFAAALPEGAPIFLYHCRDDEIVPFAHLGLYAQRMPQATIRELDGRGHQLKNDLSEVAEDIRGLQRERRSERP
jgi:predicted alpha/beta hydrolase family esterase